MRRSLVTPRTTPIPIVFPVWYFLFALVVIKLRVSSFLHFFPHCNKRPDTYVKFETQKQLRKSWNWKMVPAVAYRGSLNFWWSHWICGGLYGLWQPDAYLQISHRGHFLMELNLLLLAVTVWDWISEKSKQSHPYSTIKFFSYRSLHRSPKMIILCVGNLMPTELT
jgi:hypothetical protein